MIGFMFTLVIAILILGLLWYVLRWGIATLGLPQPILVIVTVLFDILFLYAVWAYFPASGMGLPARVR